MQVFKAMKRPFHLKADDDDYKKYSTLIKEHGGKISKKLTFASLTLTSEKYRNYIKDTFKLEYITDCINKQELLNYYLYSWSINTRNFCAKCTFLYKSYSCLGSCNDYKKNSPEKCSKTSTDGNNLQLIHPRCISPQPSTSKQNDFRYEGDGEGDQEKRRDEIINARKKKENITDEMKNRIQVIQQKEKTVDHRIEKCHVNKNTQGLITLKEKSFPLQRELFQTSRQKINVQPIEERLKENISTELEEKLKFYNIRPSWVVLKKLQIPLKTKITTEKQIFSQDKLNTNSESEILQNNSNITSKRRNSTWKFFRNNSKNTFEKPIILSDESPSDSESKSLENKSKITSKKRTSTPKESKINANWKFFPNNSKNTLEKSIILSDDETEILENNSKITSKKQISSSKESKIDGKLKKSKNTSITLSDESLNDSKLETVKNKSKIASKLKIPTEKSKYPPRKRNLSNIESNTVLEWFYPANKSKNKTEKQISSSKELDISSGLKIFTKKLKITSRKQILNNESDSDSELETLENKSKKQNSERDLESETTLHNKSKEQISPIDSELKITSSENPTEPTISKYVKLRVSKYRTKKAKRYRVPPKKRILISDESETELESNLPVVNNLNDSSNLLDRLLDSVLNEENDVINPKRRKISDNCETRMEIIQESSRGNSSRHNDNISDDSDVDKMARIFTQGTSNDSEHDLFETDQIIPTSDESTLLMEQNPADSFDSLEAFPASVDNNRISSSLDNNLNSSSNVPSLSNDCQPVQVNSSEFSQSDPNIDKEGQVSELNNNSENRSESQKNDDGDDLLDPGDREALLDEDSENRAEIQKTNANDDDLLHPDDREALLHEDSETDFENTVLNDDNQDSLSIIEVEVKKVPIHVTVINLDDEIYEENNGSDIQIIDSQQSGKLINAKIEKQSQLKTNNFLDQQKSSGTDLIPNIVKQSQRFPLENPLEDQSLGQEEIIRNNLRGDLIPNIVKQSQRFPLENPSEDQSLGQEEIIGNNPRGDLISTIEKQSQHFPSEDQSLGQEEIIENNSRGNLISSIEKESQHFFLTDKSIEQQQREVIVRNSIESLISHIEKQSQQSIPIDQVNENRLIDSQEDRQIFTQNRRIDSQIVPNREINSPIDSRQSFTQSNRQIDSQIDSNDQQEQQSNQEINSDSDRQIFTQFERPQINGKIDSQLDQEMINDPNDQQHQNQQIDSEFNHQTTDREINQQTVVRNNREIDENFRQIDSRNGEEINQEISKETVDNDSSCETIIYEEITKKPIIRKSEQKENIWKDFLSNVENCDNDNDDDDAEKENSLKINLTLDLEKLIPPKTSVWDDWNSSDSN